MTKHTFVLNLRRESPNEQWGFSLVGGSDQGAPLIITKVSFLFLKLFWCDKNKIIPHFDLKKYTKIISS